MLGMRTLFCDHHLPVATATQSKTSVGLEWLCNAQLADAEDVLRDAEDTGAVARQQAAEEVAAGQGPGAELLAAARAALSDDINTPQACSQAVHASPNCFVSSTFSMHNTGRY